MMQVYIVYWSCNIMQVVSDHRQLRSSVSTDQVRCMFKHVCMCEVSACVRAGRIIYRNPALSEMATYQGLFLTSAARTPQPVEEIRWLHRPGSPVHHFVDFTAVRRVQQIVIAHLEA